MGCVCEGEPFVRLFCGSVELSDVCEGEPFVRLFYGSAGYLGRCFEQRPGSCVEQSSNDSGVVSSGALGAV